MRRALVATIVTLILFFSSAVGHLRQATDAQLRGRVYDAMGNPISGVIAKLLLNAKEIRGVITDENGRFEISGVPAGEYLLSLESRGFATRRVRVNIATRQIESIQVSLDIGVHFDHVPSGVSGIVRLRNGVPLADANVMVLNPFDQRVISTGLTDSSGHYQLEVYLGGQYIVVVHKPGLKVAAVPIVLDQQKSLNFIIDTISPPRRTSRRGARRESY